MVGRAQLIGPIVAALIIGLIASAAPTSGAADLVLCDGQTISGWTTTPRKLDAAKDARMGDPAIRKVIRNCTFAHSARSAETQPAIIIVAAANVLITGSTFRDIHTGVPGNGVHGIAIRGAEPADQITIELSRFEDIAADGVQAGDNGPNVTNLTIRDSTFVAPATGGENAIDIKGTLGPTMIAGNDVSGFRPCDREVSDCSGSQGAGIVIHDSGGSGARPQDVTISGGRIHNNERGITLAQADRVSVTGVDFCANIVDVYLGADNGEVTIGENTACAVPAPSPAVASPTPVSTPLPTVSPSPQATPAPTAAPSPSPTPAPTATPQPWWCAWLPGWC